MSEKIISEGECVFCKKHFKKGGINRHLKSHLSKMDDSKGTDKGSFLLKIEPNPKYYELGYFLYLWVDGKTKLIEIDVFLRQIWLECCGHLSMFVDTDERNKARGLDFFNFDEKLPGEMNMEHTAKKVFFNGKKMDYTYDFGSSTELVVEVVDSYKMKAPEPIVLLSRNEPLKILCEECKKVPATQTCTIHSWEENSLFCEKCAKKHAKKCPDFEDYAALPVVNSPRFGVCAYYGGSIDTQRDHAFKE